jgi:hypothetical protein
MNILVVMALPLDSVRSTRAACHPSQSPQENVVKNDISLATTIGYKW